MDLIFCLVTSFLFPVGIETWTSRQPVRMVWARQAWIAIIILANLVILVACLVTLLIFEVGIEPRTLVWERLATEPWSSFIWRYLIQFRLSSCVFWCSQRWNESYLRLKRSSHILSLSLFVADQSWQVGRKKQTNAHAHAPALTHNKTHSHTHAHTHTRTHGRTHTLSLKYKHSNTKERASWVEWRFRISNWPFKLLFLLPWPTTASRWRWPSSLQSIKFNLWAVAFIIKHASILIKDVHLQMYPTDGGAIRIFDRRISLLQITRSPKN